MNALARALIVSLLGCGARSELNTWASYAQDCASSAQGCDPEQEVLPVVSWERFGWTSRDAPVVMGSIQGRACFLTRVGGKFDSADDGVQILAQRGQWLLMGMASDGGFVEAAAVCVAARGISAEAHWQQGDEPVVLSSEQTHACFLTAASGRFEGGAEVLSVSRSEGAWTLSGTSLQPELSGSARCMLMPSTSAAFGMEFDTPSPLRSMFEQDGVCYLSVLCGDLGAEGDVVETEWNGAGWELRRQVGGTRSLRASGVCIGRNAETGIPAPDE